LAFGLTVLTMCYAIGHISGCHLNPAVSVGTFRRRQVPASDLAPYVIAQVAGGILGAGALSFIASGKEGFDLAGRGCLEWLWRPPPGHYALSGCFVAELVLSFMFLVILGSTGTRAPHGFAPLAIGLGLTLIHLIGIPVTNLSVNPARSTGSAVFVQGWAIARLWLFWLVPILGAALAGIFYSWLAKEWRPGAKESSAVRR
jgi:aquaporin Z